MEGTLQPRNNYIPCAGVKCPRLYLDQFDILVSVLFDISIACMVLWCYGVTLYGAMVHYSAMVV